MVINNLQGVHKVTPPPLRNYEWKIQMSTLPSMFQRPLVYPKVFHQTSGKNNNWVPGGGGGWGRNPNILSSNPYLVLLLFQGADKRIRIVTAEVFKNCTFISCHFWQGLRRPIHPYKLHHGFSLSFKWNIPTIKMLTIKHFKLSPKRGIKTFNRPMLRKNKLYESYSYSCCNFHSDAFSKQSKTSIPDH